jgi:uncharacterized membrane protein YedE/YeeE
MHIDWSHFTPNAAFAGGLVIGIAAAAFALLLGRIAGVSGIVGGLLRPERGDVAWRVAFVAGMLLAPVAYAIYDTIPQLEIDASYPLVIAAGVIVGIGTRFGAGCTSGHGVCGISRRSRRSVLATASFMVAGFVTVYLTRHAFGGLL